MELEDFRKNLLLYKIDYISKIVTVLIRNK